MPVDTFFLVKSFVTLVVVIDPDAAVPLFLALTDRYEPRQRYRAAWQAPGDRADHRGLRPVRSADPAVPGDQASQLEAAGGLLLLVVALDLLRGEVEGLSGEGQVNIAFVPLGTPLLARPGAIAAIMREASTASERVGSRSGWPAWSLCCG